MGGRRNGLEGAIARTSTFSQEACFLFSVATINEDLHDLPSAKALTSSSDRSARTSIRPSSAHQRRSRHGKRKGVDYFGKEFHGRITASDIRYDMNAMVAAHPTYPFGTWLRVTNLANGRSTSVRIVDRGPTPQLRARGIIIDVSRRAAEVLGFIQRGRARVRLEVLA